MGFMGTHENRVDTKGRVSIPAGFRAVLRDSAGEGPVKLVLRPSHRFPCVEGWPLREFEKLTPQVDDLPMFGEDFDNLSTALFADAHTVESDREGRIVLPERLARHAGITEAVSFMGQGKIFAIWEPGAANRRKLEAAAAMEKRNLALGGRVPA
ncbi:MAG TPA: division/cell wall cluster transcriptional repressor MraZ [Acetobacteraceae bacterium]|nr:division/cell wall cluster transcriptional repressor MraZ [Acetobacteraceae bacterium]